MCWVIGSFGGTDIVGARANVVEVTGVTVPERLGFQVNSCVTHWGLYPSM